jgi:phosphoglycolate phosphatase/AHBA synthesis associated protein
METGELRAVLFDMDGVLLDSIEAWFRLVNGAAEILGYPAIPRELFDANWGQGMQADAVNFFPGCPVPKIEGTYLKHFREYTDHISVDPDARRVLEAMHRGGLATAVITNTPTPIATEVLAAARLEPKVLVGATDVENDKPAPDMVHLACERLEVDRSAAVVVGDSRYDRDAARAAGVRFVGLGIDGDERIETLAAVLDLVRTPR